MPARHFRTLPQIVFGVCTLSTWASADTPPARTASLSWVRLAGAEECVSARDLALDVEKRFGRALFVSPGAADISVEGHVEPAANKKGFRAAIVLRDAKGAVLGTRELSRADASCEEMRESLALVVAVMIDPDATLSPPPAKQTPPPAQTAKPPPPVKPAPCQAAAPSLPIEAGASLLGGAGFLPNVGSGVWLGAAIDPWKPFALEAFGTLWFDNTAEPGGPGEAAFSLASAGVGICPLRSHGARVHSYLCATGQLGVIKSHGRGFDQSRPDEQRFFAAAGIEGRLTIRIAGPLAARAGLSLNVPFVRDIFVYRQPSGEQAEIFRMAPLAVSGDLGLGVVFP